MQLLNSGDTTGQVAVDVHVVRIDHIADRAVVEGDRVAARGWIEAKPIDRDRRGIGSGK